MSMMPIVRSLRRNLFLVLLLVSTMMLSGQVLGQRYVLGNTIGTPGSGPGQYINPLDVTGDSDGNLYTTDCLNHRIYKYGPDGTLRTSWGTFGSAAGQLNQPHGIAVDNAGRVYVTEYANSRIQVFDTDGNHLFSFGQSGTADGSFVNPRAITYHPSGYLFIADDATRKIQKFTRDGVFVSAFGGHGTAESQFQRLLGIAIDAAGNVLGVDLNAGKIKRFTADGQFLSSFQTAGTGAGQIGNPHYVKVDKNGYIYVSAYVNAATRGQVLKFNHRGEFITSFTPHTVAVGAFYPMNPYVDAKGDVYVADYGTQVIYKFVQEYPTYQLKRRVFSPALDNNWGTDGQMHINPDGSYFLANNALDAHVNQVSATGDVLRDIHIGGYVIGGVMDNAGNIYANLPFPAVTQKYGPDNTLLGQWSTVSGSIRLAIDRNNILWTPTRGSGVRRYSLDGTYLSTFAGGAGAANNQVQFPTGIVFDHLDNVYVLDTDLARLQKFDSNGNVLSIFSIPTRPELPHIEGLSIDKNGNLYVMRGDHGAGNDCDVLIFSPEGILVSTLSGVKNLTASMDVDAFGNIHAYIASATAQLRSINVYEPVFPTDTQAPTSSFSSSSVSPWNTVDVSASIIATDAPGGSGVKEIHYAINQGAETVVTGSSASFTLTDNGTHSIAYWAVDNAGNVETTSYVTIKIDKIAPLTTLTRADGQLTLSAVDAHSGVSTIKVQVNGGDIVDYSGPFSDYVHTVRYWSEDVAGNVEASRTEIINPGLKYLTVSQRFLTGGYGTLGTIELEAPAPAGGIVVNLSVPIFVLGTVPPTVTVPEGETSASFEIDVVPVGRDEAMYIQARLFETYAADYVIIQAPKPYRVTLANATIAGGTLVQGEVSINGPAADKGVVVALTSSSLSVLVPSTVTIPAGQMSTTFTATSNVVSVDTTATIAATLNAVRTKSTLSILGPKVSAVTVASASIASTATTSGTITLSTNAPVGGKVVTLSSSNAGVASVPVSVTVPAGSNTATFTITAGTVAANTAVTITASTNGSSGTATVTITPPAAALSGITTNVAAVTGGVAVTGTVTLTRAAPTGGAVIVLASSPTTVGTVPASVTVPAGATSVTFTITTRTVTAASTLTVTGTYLGVAKAVSITVHPVRLVSTLKLNPTSVKGGTNSTGTVTLTGPATEAVVVTLTSGTTTVARVPTSVTVPAGATTATFTITTLTQTATRTSIITARTGTTSRTATLSVTR